MNHLLNNPSLLTLGGIFVLLLVLDIIRVGTQKQFIFSRYFHYIWFFFLILLLSEFVSFYIASWGYGILCFIVLREYFSLVDLRLQDRLGILAAYFSIPFMMHYVHTDWYNMFIITIPVYSFLVIPFLISIMSKETEGAIYSIGTIDFGLFLFVYCLGHLAYLSYYSTWMAGMLILNITVCDTISFYVDDKKSGLWKKILFKYVISTPLTILLTFLLSEWTGIPKNHSIILGSIIPALVIIGNHTINYFETDLGIIKENIRPGRGLIIDNIKSILYTSPIVLHYIRYFLL